MKRSPYAASDSGRRDFACEDCGCLVLGYRDGQVPLCVLCRAPYVGPALAAWITWIMYPERAR